MHNSNSSVLDAPLAKDAFLSAMLGKSVYRLPDPARASDAIASLATDGAWMVETKVPVDTPAALGPLVEVGFRVMDTNVQLDRRVAGFAPNIAPPWLSVRQARPDDRSAVERIAADHLVTSRFHMDPQIGSALGRRIKAAWAGNFFERRRGDALFVAERDGVPQGFLLVLHRAEVGIIDLIALNPVVRGHGVADALVYAWIARTPELQRLVVGTQIANTQSLRSYAKLGFRVCDATYVLHCHGPSPATGKGSFR